MVKVLGKWGLNLGEDQCEGCPKSVLTSKYSRNIKCGFERSSIV